MTIEQILKICKERSDIAQNEKRNEDMLAFSVCYDIISDMREKLEKFQETITGY
jgi:hypothetical protein